MYVFPPAKRMPMLKHELCILLKMDILIHARKIKIVASDELSVTKKLFCGLGYAPNPTNSSQQQRIERKKIHGNCRFIPTFGPSG